MEDRIDGVRICGAQLALQVGCSVKIDDVDTFFPRLIAGGLGKQQGDLVAGTVEGICQSAAKSSGGVIGNTTHLVQWLNGRSGSYKAVHCAKI